MWSHYAESHKGVVIEYTDYTDDQLRSEDLKGVINPFNEGFEELPIVRNALPVQYLSTEQLNHKLDQLPQNLDELNKSLQDYNTGPLTDEKYRSGFIVQGMAALFLKHRDWSYEEEYRIVTAEGNKSIAVPGTVTTIFLGMRTSEEQCQQVYRIGIEIGARVLKMERVNKKYALAPRELTDNEKKRGKLDFSRPIHRHISPKT